MAAAVQTADLQTPDDFPRALRRDHAGYLVSIGLLALGNLLLLPLVTTALTPQQIGLYSLVEAGTSLGSTISLLGLKFAYLYHHARLPASARPALLGTALLVAAATAIATGTLLALLYGSSTAMTWFGATPLDHLWLLPLLMLGGVTQALLITELRAERRVALAGSLAVGNLVVWLSASTAFVLWAGLGVPGLFAGQICGQAVAILIGLSRITRRPLFAWDRTQVRPLVSYGTPLMLGLLLRYALDSLSRFLLAAWVGIAAAGDFLIAARVAVLFEALLALPFFMAWGGLVHHALQRPQAAAILERVAGVTLAGGALMLTLLLALQPWLFQLFAGAPRPDLAPLFAFTLLSQYFVLIKSPLSAGLLRIPNTGWSLRNNLLALLLFLPFVGPAMHWAGAAGAAAGIAAINLVTGLVVFRQAQKLCPQHPRPEAGLLLAGLIALCMLTLIMGSLPSWYLLPLFSLAAWLLWQSARPVAAPDPL